MLLARIIRQPKSLEHANEQFRQWAEESGYRLISTPHAYWQENLFTEQRDALVEASARRP